MKNFTKLDQEFAKNIDKRFKWIARDQSGDLYIFHVKPYKTSLLEWNCDRGPCIRIWLDVPWIAGALTTKLFEPIKWNDDEPTLISDIYNSTA